MPKRGRSSSCSSARHSSLSLISPHIAFSDRSLLKTRASIVLDGNPKRRSRARRDPSVPVRINTPPKSKIKALIMRLLTYQVFQRRRVIRGGAAAAADDGCALLYPVPRVPGVGPRLHIIGQYPASLI